MAEQTAIVPDSRTMPRIALCSRRAYEPIWLHQMVYVASSRSRHPRGNLVLVTGLMIGLASLALGTPGRLDAALPPALAPTPYARYGDAPAAALMGLIWLGFAARRLTRR